MTRLGFAVGERRAAQLSQLFSMLAVAQWEMGTWSLWWGPGVLAHSSESPWNLCDVFCMLMRWLVGGGLGELDSSRIGASLQKDCGHLRKSNFKHQPTPTPGRGEGLEIELIANGQKFNQSCLCSEASIKTPKRWGVSRASGLVNASRCWQVGLLGEGTEFHAAPMYLAPSGSSIWPLLSCILYNKLVTVSSVSSSSKSSNLKSGSQSQSKVWVARGLVIGI